jgi:tetratricopeptide (TPR) repeat protein/DNA-binding winged helix-turn-helix (wHTH) protein
MLHTRPRIGPPTNDSAVTYHFGKFTLQKGDRRLSSDGHEIYLRPKTYDTLVYLIERQGHLVTKRELLDAVWADVEVTENALTRCIKEARIALGDVVQNPGFLRTIPRLGYEFIAHVERLDEPTNWEVVEEEFRAVRVVTTEEDTDGEPSAPVTSVVVSKPTLGPGRPILNLQNLAVVVFLLLSLSAAYWQWSSRVIPARSTKRAMVAVLSLFGHNARPGLVLTPPDYVLISDFENQTGDPVFDRSLNTALASSLEQSSLLNVYSRTRMKEALKRMEKPNVEHIDEALALEIAEREGVKAVVVPTIGGIGESYWLAARIRAAPSGEDIKTEVSRARSKERVLDAVDELAAAVRGDLGESIQKISERKPLAAATTPSLEALKQYSLGLEKHRAGEVQEAKTLYENALSIDPTFTTAVAELGMLHMDQAAMGIPHFNAEVGKHLLSEAVLHVSNLTEKEKYAILAFHAQWVEHDLEKAAGYHIALLATYPEYPVAYSNLSWVYNRMGRYEESIATAKEAIRIDPRLLIAYANLAGVQLYQQGDVKSALETCQRALQVDSRYAWAYDCVGWALLGKNDWAQAQAAFEKAVRFNPQSTLSRYRLAHAQRLQGHYQPALQTLEHILKIDPSDATPWYDMGVVYEGMGDHKKAREHFERFRHEMESLWGKDAKNADTAFCLAGVLSRLGQTEDAMSWARKGIALDPSKHFEYATILSLNQRKREAVEQLRIAIQQGYRHYIFIKIHPDLQPLHGEPEFEKLLAGVIKS